MQESARTASVNGFYEKLEAMDFQLAKTLAEWITQQPSIWQMSLMSAAELASFASDRAVDFRTDDVETLWRVGLLRADLVEGPTRLRLSGLFRVGTLGPGPASYADVRPFQRYPRG